MQLHSWQQPPRWRERSRNYWTRTFEAEDTDLFTHPIGEEDTDDDGRVARHAEAGLASPGLLLNSRESVYLRRNETARFAHHVFWLKTDDASGTDHIATIRVIQPDGTIEYCYYAFRSDGSAPENPDDNQARQAGQCSEATVSGTKRDTTLTSLFSNTLYGVKIKAASKEGTGPFSTQRTATTRSAAAKALAEQMVLTGMEGLAALAAPNPFNPGTTIYFQVPEAEEVSLVIYGLNGQVVRTLIEGRLLKPGINDLFWEGTDEEGRPVAAGVYLYRLKAGEQALVQKMTLLR